ncbi:Hpt domain-containing protein [Tabrizicola sp. M-4]|uniref:Hpt domain-containing protein n=1 Tax=Tabrizicola sp. M-4 TaxID=3055847 RepID=UPI003DA913E1
MSDEMDEIWALYADDGAQALDAMETALMALGDGSGADAGSHVGALFRAVHTFKGNSRVLGLSVVESRAHYAEDLIGLVRDQGVPWDAEIKDILLLASDTLRAMLEETAATHADVAPDSSEDLMVRLKDKIARASGTSPEEASPAPAEPAAAAPAAAPLDMSAFALLSDLGDSDSSRQEDDDYWSDEPAAEAAAEVEPAAEPVQEAQPEPAPAPQPETVAAEPAAPVKRLADDPSYREIFRNMVVDALRKLTDAAASFDGDAPAIARREVDNLAHAAKQMGLDDWHAPMQAYLADAAPTVGTLNALLATLHDLNEATYGVAKPASAAPAAEPQHEPAPEAAAPAKRLADDPSYREIFRNMVVDALRKLTDAAASFEGDTPARARREVDNLAHAAKQMGLDDWHAPMQAYLADPAPTVGTLNALLATLHDLNAATYGVAKPAPAATPAPAPQPEPAAPAPAPEPVAAAPIPAPALAPAPKAAAKAKPGEKRLADDPTYRDIFRGMATDATRKLSDILANWNAESPAKSRREVDGLHHAATQMGLDDWAEPLSAYLGELDPGSETLAALLLALADLSERTFGTPKPTAEAATEDSDFFDKIAKALADIAASGNGFFCGETPDPQAVSDNVGTIRRAAKAAGYIRVEEAAARIPAAQTAQDFHAAELRLYEELAGVEAVMPDAARASGVSPREMLQKWCAEHVFSTLSELEATLERLKAGEDLDSNYIRLDRLMRLVHHACGHHKIETAGQLAMSLIDLFSRLHTLGQTPDAILSHVARGFIDTIEIVFDAITQGQTPDTASLDKLFEEASNICFVQDGVMTASAIERRLGLPKEFHRVLSPESVRAASEAIEAGLRFFIVRADINNDEKLAEAFITWLSGDTVHNVTNVTVFQGNDTLFDFLLASALDEAGMGEALAAIDSSARYLKLTRMLVPTTDTEEAAPADPEAALAQIPQAGISAEMVEQIGEIAASQSMISHMLTELAEDDIFESVDAMMRAAGQDWKRARPSIRTALTRYATKLQELAQLETQLVGQITQLQEQTVEIRSRRIETIFRPLEAFVQTYSRRNRREAVTSFAGGELTLDLTILENLRRVLRNLAVARLETGAGAPRSLHISFHRDEERVLAIYQDDGGTAESSAALDEVHAAVTRMGGELRQVALPGAGVRFHISLPLAMVVLEGMVVGVQGVRYVVPVDAIRMILQPDADRRFRVSAADGREMLRIGNDEIVAIQPLPGPQGGVHGTTQSRNVFVVLGAQGRSVAVPVDELVGQQLVLLRPLKGVLSGMQNMTGIALLAGGDVGMVVSANLLCAAQAPTHSVNTSLRM